MPDEPRPLAPHVHAAIGRAAAQPKRETEGRQMASHVAAAISPGEAPSQQGSVQAQRATSRIRAPHVQAAIGAKPRQKLGLQPRSVVPGQRSPAPHVAAAIGASATPTPTVQTRQAQRSKPFIQHTAWPSPYSALRAVLQRAANNYVEERNPGDVEEAGTWFKVIKKHVTKTNEPTPYGKFTIWEVALSSLPEKVQQQIITIRETDFSDLPWSLYPRDFHSNTGGHLPETDPSNLDPEDVRKTVFHGWSGDSSRVDLRGYRAQYAEYHITESGLGKAFRLLYDYVNEVFYISLSHYNIWDEEKPPFFRVDLTK